MVTRDKLLVEDAEEERAQAAPVETAVQDTDTRLDETESRFLGCLLYGKPYDALLRGQGLLLSVVVDSVNEKLFDLFHDTVLIEGGGGPELLEDYQEELKGMFPQ